MPSSKVPASDATLRILSYLSRQRGPVPASAIEKALQIPRSSTYHLLNVLIRHRYVIHLAESRRYGLGLAAYELSSGFSKQNILSQVGRPIVAGMVDRLGQSGHLAVLSGSDSLYLVEERAPQAPHLVSEVGVRLPAHLTASGRAMLQHLPAEQLRALYPNNSLFTTRTGKGPRSYQELKQLLKTSRQAGYSVEDGLVTEGLSSVAVAVLDHVGWPIASIAVTYSRPPQELEELIKAVTEASKLLQKRIHAA